jgi:hypothetical protein
MGFFMGVMYNICREEGGCKRERNGLTENWWMRMNEFLGSAAELMLSLILEVTHFSLNLEEKFCSETLILTFYAVISQNFEIL